MIDHNEDDSIWITGAGRPRWPAKWRRQHYRAVAAELIFSNKSRSPNCGAARLLTATTFGMTPPMPSPVQTAGAPWVLHATSTALMLTIGVMQRISGSADGNDDVPA